MAETSKRQAQNAEAQARLRQGVKAELREIKAEIQNLRDDLAPLIRKSSTQEGRYAD